MKRVVTEVYETLFKDVRNMTAEEAVILGIIITMLVVFCIGLEAFFNVIKNEGGDDDDL